MVTNLLSNAVNTARAPQSLEVRAAAGRRGVVWLSRRDDGIGIAPEHQARIFGRFERAVSERHYGGLGWACGSCGRLSTPWAAPSPSRASQAGGYVHGAASAGVRRPTASVW